MIWWFEKNKEVSWFITITGAVLIFWISSLPAKAFYPGIGIQAILYHILAFFCFSFFLLISIVRGEKNSLLFSLAILIAVSYALTDEIHQYFVPGRMSAFFDMFLNLVGILFAVMVYVVIILRRK